MTSVSAQTRAYCVVGSSTTVARDKIVAEAAVTALDGLKADGTYDKLFDQYGVNKLDLSHFAIRGPRPG